MAGHKTWRSCDSVQVCSGECRESGGWIKSWKTQTAERGLFYFFNPVSCKKVFIAIVLLESEPPAQSWITGRLKQALLKNIPVFSIIYISLNSDSYLTRRPFSIKLGSLANCPFVLWKTLKCAFLFLAFFLTTLLFSPVLWSVQGVVIFCTNTPVSAVELCSSFRLTFAVCVFFLINALLVRSVTFCLWPSLGASIVVPCSFHVKTMDLIVFLRSSTF